MFQVHVYDGLWQARFRVVFRHANSFSVLAVRPTDMLTFAGYLGSPRCDATCARSMFAADLRPTIILFWWDRPKCAIRGYIGIKGCFSVPIIFRPLIDIGMNCPGCLNNGIADFTMVSMRSSSAAKQFKIAISRFIRSRLACETALWSRWSWVRNRIV